MATLYRLLLICVFTTSATFLFGQKQTFDVVSFAIPKNWQQQQIEGGVQLSISDKASGGYAIAIVTKAVPTNVSSNENFTNQWNNLIKAAVTVTGEPVMAAHIDENGWNILSGNANYTDAGTKGIATLITATGYGKSVSVLLMTNTQKYQQDILAFSNSLEIAKQQEITTSPTTQQGLNMSIVGLWFYNLLETNGNYVNGFPQYTAGYYRSEYLFKGDGTYIFRTKNWSVYLPDILFIYETGSWKINGNKLTLTPNKGIGEWWGKSASGRTVDWGARKKASDYKPETATYSFFIRYYSGSKDTSLQLEDNKKDVRSYTLRTFTTSLIDNPPGFKIAAENTTSPLTGKLWEGTSTEKFTTGTTSGYNTGGFSTSQYKFNTDGTYRFVNVLASHYTDTKTLGYETGNWSVNGNQLTINPSKGQNEEWSKVGKTSNGNSDVTNRAINETWNKKLKTNTRKLEKYTYTFSIDKNGDKTALILKEDDGTTSYLNETTATKSVKLPNGIN